MLLNGKRLFPKAFVEKSRDSCLTSQLLEVVIRVRAQLLQLCPNTLQPYGLAHQASLSMGFSRQEYWSGLPCPPPGDCPNPGIKLASFMSPTLAGRFFTAVPLGKPELVIHLGKTV